MEEFSSQEQISFIIASIANDTLRHHLDSARFDVLENVMKLELLVFMTDLSCWVLHYSHIKIITF